MREPTTAAQALRWHNKALIDKALHLPIEVDFEAPHCGWFVTRACRGGPWVPARLWIEQEVCPDTGELLSDEVMRCEINGKLRDPYEAWIWLCSEPIDQARHAYLVARKDFAETWAPSEPAANAFVKVDWGKVPTPSFTKEPTP